MATDNPEQEALPRGIAVDALANGPWLCNVLERKQALLVRGGFGQESQNDSTLTLRDPGLGSRQAQTFGYTAVLGTFAIRTRQGTRQICTLLAALGYTGSGWNGSLGSTRPGISSGTAQTFAALSVHDADTNETQEYLLHRHTAENSQRAGSPQDWRGMWNGCNSQAWAEAVRGTSQRAWFCEFRDTLLFGTPELGAWAYRPTDTQGLRRQWIETHKDPQNVSGYSESSACFPLVGGDGAFSDTYAYLPAANWPRIVDACAVGNRIAYADESNIYVSDPGNPLAINVLNIMPSGSDKPLRAIASQLGQLLAFTDSETWSFNVPDTAVVSGGRRIRMSETVGCLGPQAKTSAAAALYWADQFGVYSTTGNLEIKDETGGIAPLFVDGLQNPLTYWWQTQLAGYVPADAAHIRNNYLWQDAGGVCFAYERVLGLVFALMPALNAALVLQDGHWKVWTWDTLAVAVARTASVTRNVQAQTLACIDGDVWLATGIDVMTPADQAKSGGTVPLNENQPFGSYALLQMDRGGALDRSAEATEDGRLGGGWYTAAKSVSANDGAAYLGEPVPVPQGYVLPQGSAMPAAGLLYPVVLRSTTLAANSPPDNVRIVINYDDSNWTPVCFGGTKCDVLFPAPRMGSRTGWGYTAPLAGFREIQVYGNQIRMFYLGAGAAGAGPARAPGRNVCASNAISSAASFKSSAARFCSRYFCCLVPGIGIISSPCASNHASATCAVVAWCAAAICSTGLSNSRLRSRFPG